MVSRGISAEHILIVDLIYPISLECSGLGVTSILITPCLHLESTGFLPAFFLPMFVLKRPIVCLNSHGINSEYVLGPLPCSIILCLVVPFLYLTSLSIEYHGPNLFRLSFHTNDMKAFRIFKKKKSVGVRLACV